MSLHQIRQTAFDAVVARRTVPMVDVSFANSISARILKRRTPDLAAFARDWELNYVPNNT